MKIEINERKMYIGKQTKATNLHLIFQPYHQASIVDIFEYYETLGIRFTLNFPRRKPISLGWFVQSPKSLGISIEEVKIAQKVLGCLE